MNLPEKAKDMFRLLFIFAFAATVFSPPAKAGGETLPPTIKSALDQAHLPESSLSLSVTPIQDSGKPFHWQADKAVNPASLMKLLTSYAALDKLGPAFQWTTELHASRPPEKGILTGDIYLKGYGDPKLTMEQLWLLLRNLKAREVHEIRGDLVLDRSYFELSEKRADFDDDANKPESPYLVVPDALLLNFKAVRLILRAQDSQVHAALEPSLTEIELENHLLATPADDCSNWQSGIRIKVKDSGRRARISLTGNLPAGCTGERQLATLDHPTYVASLFKKLWLELGGKWTGQARQGTLPPQSEVLAAIQSPALPLVLRDINKLSNNVMARQVYLTLGAVLGDEADGADTASRSKAVMQHWLAEKNWHWPELVQENGSGLSRHERISSRHLADLLIDAWQGPLAAEFVSSLPITGIDGTMKRRLRDETLTGQAHIKTGTLKDVRSIAGYVRGQNGKTWCVAAIINHPRAASGGREVLDEVIREIASWQ